MKYEKVKNYDVCNLFLTVAERKDKLNIPLKETVLLMLSSTFPTHFCQYITYLHIIKY